MECEYCGMKENSKLPFVLRQDLLEVHVDGQIVKLTKAEMKILCPMVEGFNRGVTYEFLVESIYIIDADVPDDSHNLIKVYIHKLRKKLKNTPIKIKTIWGWGITLTYEKEGQANGEV